MFDHFALIVLGFIMIILLYVIVLLNGRQFKYFKILLDSERNQNTYLFDLLTSPRISLPDLAPPENEGERGQVRRRTDKIEKEIENLM